MWCHPTWSFGFFTWRSLQNMIAKTSLIILYCCFFISKNTHFLFPLSSVFFFYQSLILSNCISLQNYNGVKSAGSRLVLYYQILFDGTSAPPKVYSVTFNGALQCFNEPVPPPTITGGLKLFLKLKLRLNLSNYALAKWYGQSNSVTTNGSRLFIIITGVRYKQVDFCMKWSFWD